MTKRTRRNHTPGFKAKVALAAVKGMGAAQPEVEVSEHKSYYPNAVDDRGLMQAVVTARAVGRP